MQSQLRRGLCVRRLHGCAYRASVEKQDFYAAEAGDLCFAQNTTFETTASASAEGIEVFEPPARVGRFNPRQLELQ
jgi:hypothetical protein